jgi:hypothetical protein
MSASELFVALMTKAKAPLNRAGFTGSGRTFRVKHDRNVGLIDFQRSVKSSSRHVVFTINLGVWSGRVATSISGTSAHERPGIEDCHWRERVGFLLSDQQDKWWTVENNLDAEAVQRELLPLLEVTVVPAVLTHVSDTALRDTWLDESAPGLTEFQRLMYLTILLKELGPTERLADVVANLKTESEGKATEAIVQHHLRKLAIQ